MKNGMVEFYSWCVWHFNGSCCESLHSFGSNFSISYNRIKNIETSITKWKAREIEIESDWCQIRILLLLFEYPLHSSCNYHYRFVFFGSLIGFGAKKTCVLSRSSVVFVSACIYIFIHAYQPFLFRHVFSWHQKRMLFPQNYENKFLGKSAGCMHNVSSFTYKPIA